MNVTDIHAFLNAGAARAAVRRLRLRRSLQQIVASGSALLDCIDHISQVERDRAFTLVESCGDLRERDVEGSVRRLAIHLVEGQDVREQELLQGADLVLQLLNALQEGIGHGLFSVTNTQLANAEPATPHRLSEISK